MEITSSCPNKHGGWKLVRVFISSTFKDLGAERDYLVRFIFPKLRLELLKWHVHLLDIDLRWGVAETQDTIGVCTEIIDECRPRFICILGENYGSVIEGQDKSYTIMEIEHSLRGLPAGKRPKEYRFFYFRDHDVLKKIPEADLENSGLVDKNPQKREKLKKCKASIMAEGFNPYIYRARWDKKLKRLVDLEDFGDHVYKDILGSVIDELGDEPPKKLGEFDEENAAMDAFVEDRSSSFFPGSRAPLIMKITSFAEREDWQNILVVVGGPGSGKSALLSQFYLDYTQTHERDLVIGHFVGASIGFRGPKRNSSSPLL